MQYVFCIAGIKCELALGRYRYNNKILDLCHSATTGYHSVVESSSIASGGGVLLFLIYQFLFSISGSSEHKASCRCSEFCGQVKLIDRRGINIVDVT